MDAIFKWQTLPPALPAPLQEGLLRGAVGKMHVLGLARQALEAYGSGNEPMLATLGVQLLRWAWENDPLDGAMAAQLHATAKDLLPPVLQETVDAVIAHYHEPERLDYLARLLAKGDEERLRTYLAQQCAKEPDNLFWLRQAMGRAVYDGDWGTAQALLDGVRAPCLAPVVEKTRADVAFFSGDARSAAGRFALLATTPGLWSASLGRAASLHAMGQTDEAVDIWKSALATMPWNVNLVLRLHDICTGLDKALVPLPGRVAVLLYTFNKAAELEHSLRALHVGLAENATLFALDNGSNDATPQVLDTWSQRFGQRMRRVRLPVNVGAPAARNWLAEIPEVRACDWLAYVDDDAPVPPDWLGRLGAAVAACPEASVWGCRVVDARNPALLQHVDLHLCDPREVPQDPDAPHYKRRFSLSGLHHQVLDWGQFNYCRPCASVTGCVHLLRQESVDKHGGFDLRFTPSQYDDLERDLRLGVAGEQIIYQGHLRVGHHKRTGRAGRGDARENARALANQYKVQQMFSEEDLARFRRHQNERLLHDVWTKLAKLRQCGMT